MDEKTEESKAPVKVEAKNLFGVPGSKEKQV